MKGSAKRGFTLLELLIAITIFAGIMILALGAFARSASSSHQTAIVQQRTEIVRSIIDQISTDFRYLSLTTPAQDCTSGSSCTTYTGYEINPLLSEQGSLVLALKYPNGDDVRKTYTVTTDDQPTLTVKEERGCNNTFTTCDANQTSANQNLLPANYQLDLTNGGVFDGASYRTGTNDQETGFLKLAVTIKPTNLNSACNGSDAVAGSCYTVTTTLVPRGY